MDRCPSACPLLLVTPGMPVADLHADIDFTRFEMYVHGCLMRQALRSTIYLHLLNLHV